MRRESINLLIDHQCPQCGAPAVFAETDRLFECAYCRVKSYLTARGYFRFVIPHKTRSDRELIYFPYWRFKGMLFWCVSNEIHSRFVDLSEQAVPTSAFPTSLGLRPQALKLKFLTSETPGRFIAPTLTLQAIMTLFGARFKEEWVKEAVLEARIGDSVSLIYAPFYVKERIFDAVLDEPLVTDMPDDFEMTTLFGRHPGSNIRFIPTLCPKCGWDLEGCRDSLTLACGNCRTVWQANQNALAPVTVSYLPEKMGDAALYLPFWRIKAAVSGLTLATYADFARLANLPRAIRAEWERIPFFFWGPAFKVRSENYLRLLTAVTVSQPLEKLTAGPPLGTLFPVSMPLSEAAESLMIALSGLVRPQRAFFEKIQQIQIVPKSYRLVYLPFQESPHEYVQPRMNLAVNKNQLALAKNL